MNLNQKIHLNTKGKLDSLFSIIEIGSFLFAWLYMKIYRLSPKHCLMKK